MKKVIDYVLLTSENSAQLSKWVMENLEDGWELYGSPSNACARVGNYGVKYNYAQAMVKYEEDLDYVFDPDKTDSCEIN